MFDKIINKLNNIKKENQEYNRLLEISKTFINLKPLPKLSELDVKKNINQITNICPDINKEKAIIISKIIPVYETYLDVLYIKETKTNIDYWLIPTNYQIWIINEKTYGIIPYQNVTICKIVKNNLMSKIINLNNIVIEINGNDNKINNFINLLTNTEFKTNYIKEKTNYLCGITPTYQLINNINSGISIDKDNNIVFHSEKNNYKTTKDELTNYEILLDNIPIISKNQSRNTNINTFQNSCYSITLRVTTKTTNFQIPILEQNSLGTKYNIQDGTYQNNINFAKALIKKLDEIYE